MDVLAQKLGVKYSYGVELFIDDDSRMVSGEIAAHEVESCSIDVFKRKIAQEEHVEIEDVTVVSDEDLLETPGIRLDLNLETVLNLYNKHILSKENIIGLIGSLGGQRK